MFHQEVDQLLREVNDRDGSDRIDKMLRTANLLGIAEGELAEDLQFVLAQRLIFLCVGGVERSRNYRERQQAIRQRLQKLAPNVSEGFPSEELVTMLTKLSSRLSQAGSGPRETVSSLDSVTLAQMLRDQSHRCAVCGIPFVENVVKADIRFGEGIERTAEKSLEHIHPFQLFGNKTEFEILCTSCNNCKREKMGWHEDGPVICGNIPLSTISPPFRRRILFWTLYRHRRCQFDGCGSTAKDSVLYASESHTGDAAFGALTVHCSTHARSDLRWLHTGCTETDLSYFDSSF